MKDPTPRLGPGREFDLIRGILRDLASSGSTPLTASAGSRPRVLVGPGDDCAVLEGGIVVSCDLSVENIHFRRDWITLEEAGYRATAAALSTFEPTLALARPVSTFAVFLTSFSNIANPGVMALDAMGFQSS